MNMLPTPPNMHILSKLVPSSRASRKLLLTLTILSLAPLSAVPAQTSPAQSQSPQPANPTSPQSEAAPTSPAPPLLTANSTLFSGPQAGVTTEEDLKRQLVGKPLFLRGGYLGDSLSFTQGGDPIGHPARGSYTLCGVQIEKVRLTKHKVEFEGARYALHFLGAMPYEDSSSAVDRVKITPKKRVLRITIDRERVIKTKKVKESPQDKRKTGVASKPSAADQAAKTSVPSSETDSAAQTKQPGQSAAAAASQEPDQEPEKPEDQAADPASVTSTLSPAHAATMLREALDKIFALGIDDKIRAQMPEFWRLYYQAQAAGIDYRPKDGSILRSSAVDSQAKLSSSITPDSNEFAQANGIAGRALYRAVIGPDGKAGEIAVVRPIGFGLDENAVAAIRKASFQPATKAGQPVAETLDLAVLFRIYSKRTSVAAGETGDESKPTEPVKPGPYSARPPQPAPQPQPDQKPAPQ